MAPRSTRKKLYCHYCDCKSHLIFDGTVFQWDCSNCDASNYLDENGDITDPPVAPENSTPSAIRYATTYHSEPASSISDSNIFCALCLKNQHLFTSSLAQYYVDINNNQLEQKNEDSDYHIFRQELERRYPQVCEKCEPAVLQRIKVADKTAKTDHLRLLMDKTRSGQLKKSENSFFSIQTLGRTFWNIGFYGQLIWNFTNVITIFFHNSSGKTKDFLLHLGFDFLQPIFMVTTSRTWAFRTLLCSILSIWWFPKPKNCKKDFTKRITGIKTWYFLQFLTICLRIFFHYVISLEVFFSNTNSSKIIFAHIANSLVTILFAIRANGSIKVDVTPLWNSHLENISLRPQSVSTFDEKSQSMGDILNQIESGSTSLQTREMAPILPTSHKITEELTSSNTSLFSQNSNPQLSGMRHGYQSNNIPSFGKKTNDRMSLSTLKATNEMPNRTTPSLLQMSEEEASSYLKTGNVPSNCTFEEMDWQSTQSSHRAFNPRPKTNIQQFNHIPVSSESSPFWFRVPAAPITPAQRLRNPPNQPNLLRPQEKTKQNFFKNMTKSGKCHSELLPAKNDQNELVNYNMELSQPKFFPCETTGEAENMLADLLTGVTLENTHESMRNKSFIFGIHNLNLSVLLSVVAPIFGVFFYLYLHYRDF